MKNIITCLIILLVSVRLYGQGVSISGKITDPETNQGIAGVTVSEENEVNFSVTDTKGNFDLVVSDAYTTLVLKHPDFKTQKVFLAGQTDLNINLNTKSGSSQVNVGFGNQTKEQMTSSVSQVGSSKLSNQAVIDIEQASQGRAAGVFIQNNGGKLGEGTTVRIRGGSSLSASNAPLYVVDGVPLTSENQSDINPSDIASMEILKDASAAAIYGSRAANGVVLITTKSGVKGKMKIDVDYQFGISETPKKLDLYNPVDYRSQMLDYGLRSLQEQLLLLAFVDPNAFIALGEVEDVIAEASAETLAEWTTNRAIVLSDGTTYDFDDNVIGTNDIFGPIVSRIDSNVYKTNWQDEVFRKAISHRANINLSGGSERLQYFTGLSYTGQEGILIGNKYERLNSRLNLKSKLTSKVSANANLSYALVNNLRLNEDADLGSPLQAIALPPSDTYDPDNDYKIRVRSNDYNPLTEINFSDNIENSNQFIGNLGFQVDFTDQFKLNIEGGADYSSIRWERRQGPETQDGQPTGLSSLRTDKTLNYIGTSYLTYDWSQGENNWSAVLGASYQRSESEFSFRELRVNSIEQVEKARLDDPELLAAPIPGTGSVLVSSFSRINYSLKDKYVFQLSGRIDGSSRFGTNNRYGFFPAASAGWNLSNESFLKNNDLVSFLKLKTSYGLVGNTPDQDFLYRRNYFVINYGNNPGFRLSNLENPDLKWETTAQLDIGIDFGFIDDRLSGSLNYYRKETSDLLFPKPVSLTSGFANILQNIGTLENIGWEFNLTSVNIENDNFSWTTDFNIATNKNTVKDIDGDTLILGVNAYLEGEAVGSFFMPVYVGVDPQTGYALYEDGNGGTTDDYEEAVKYGRRVVGNPNPKFFGGLSNTISYKNFELNLLFQFVQGADRYFATGEIVSNSGILNLSQTRDQLNRWYKEGDEADFPVIDPNQDDTYSSSRWLQDGSYIRLNNLSLAYKFPMSTISGWGMQSLTVYIGGQNLLTFTNYTGYDPDVAYVDPDGGTIGQNISRGNDYFTTPQARTYTAGIKLSF